MITAGLILLGLCFGSFVNAVVWRVHEQSKGATKAGRKLSILHGRSMCPHCRHELSTLDLLPVVSWLSLRGRCRYCQKPISWQYPLVEIALALLFIASYKFWPVEIAGIQVALFVIWLASLVALMSLIVYDLRWYLLPDRILYPLAVLAFGFAGLTILSTDEALTSLLNLIMAVAVGGGLFYLIFQISAGKWIGGGDVKLGALLGMYAGTPARSLLFIFLAALLGSLVSLPLLASKRLGRGAVIPFGPFLIIGAILVQFFGADIIGWYQNTFLPFRV